MSIKSVVIGKKCETDDEISTDDKSGYIEIDYGSHGYLQLFFWP